MVKIAILFLLVFNIFILNKTYITELKKEELSYDTEYTLENKKLYFDFDGSMISDSNIVDVTIIDEYNIIPIITTSGNIEFELLSSDYNKNLIRLILPNEDGILEITLLFGEKSVIKNIYSSKKNNNYGISSLSLYSAQELVGNIPGQEYMDNDTINAPFVPTPDFESGKEPHNRVIAEGSVYGYLRWTDDANQIHPLIGAKVKLTWDGSFGEAYTYTNLSGYFYIEFHNMWTISDYGCYIHIYAKNEMCVIESSVFNAYEKVEKLTNMQNGDNYNYGTYTFSTSQDGYLGSAMQIFAAMKNYSDYARTLNGGNYIPECTLIYPSNDENSFYSNLVDIIYLGYEHPNNPSTAPSLAGSWDVIGHEYGHHLQNYYFNQLYYGTHYYDRNGIYGYLEDNSIIIPTDNNLHAAKVQGTCLAFKEAWPTFFAIAAQNSFSNDIKTIPTVGNFLYEDHFGAVKNLEDTTNTQNMDNPMRINGESDEWIIVYFLYRLWESNNYASWDNISINMSNIWTIMTTYNPANLSDFVISLFNSNLTFSRSDMGKLLEIFKISASDLTIDSTSISNSAIIPTFSWDKNGQDIFYEPADETYYFSNNKFSLVFYDKTGNFILEKQNIYSDSYTLTQDEWNSILSSYGTYYYVMIKSYATLGSETGPYYSQRYLFYKPSVAIDTVPLVNSRYYERVIAISQASSWRFTLTFDHSGYKLFQTFGLADTRIWLYEANETTPVCNPRDDEGYYHNALMYQYLQSGTTYILKVDLYDQTLSDMTKISIISMGGFKDSNVTTLSEYDHILNINSSMYALYSYVAQYNSMVVTWTPPTSDYYTISLESEFDNYLYVIDPTSDAVLVENIDFNDDADDDTYNASLTNYYDEDITYLIIYTKYSPSSAFNNLDSGDDITLRISIN